MSSKMILYFSGSVELDEDETMMQYIGKGEAMDGVITLRQYKQLPENLRGDYMLENILSAIQFGEDLEYDEISMEEQA